jgi:branched-chain amino acid transport system permease protein
MKNLFFRRYKLLIIFLAIVIAVLVPSFVHSPYIQGLLILTLVYAVLAVTFIMLLRTGLISLGITAFWGIGAYASILFVMKFHLSFWIALPASAITAGIIALALGYVLIGSGGTGFNFVVLSSVTGMLFPVVMGSVSSLGGYQGIAYIPAPDPIKIPFLPVIEFSSNVQFYYLGLFLFLIIVLIAKAFYGAWIGRAWRAIGLNPRLAQSIGVNIFRYKLSAFVLASALAGLIGSYYAHYENFIMPDNFGIWQNIYIQIYAILGGMGYAVIGPLLGSAVMIFIPEFVRMANVIAPILTGALLIILILFMPQGLLGLLIYRPVIAAKSSRLCKRVMSSLSFGHRAGKV